MRNGKDPLVAQQSGYSFIGLLILIMIVGLSLAEAGAVWSKARQREREQELLRVGDRMRTAIGEYYNQSPGMVKQFPRRLEDLLRDDRHPMPRRYLRKVYNDPMTGRPDWGLLEAPSGGIMGVYSLGIEKPYKRKNFDAPYQAFEHKNSYSDWIFAYTPELTADSSNLSP